MLCMFDFSRGGVRIVSVMLVLILVFVMVAYYLRASRWVGVALLSVLPLCIHLGRRVVGQPSCEMVCAYVLLGV